MSKSNKSKKSTSTRTSSKQNERALINIDPKATDAVKHPKRKGTKVATLVALLKRKHGATLEQISEALSATGSAVSTTYAKAWLHYDLHELHGYGVYSVRVAKTKQVRCFLIDPTDDASVQNWKDALKAESEAQNSEAIEAAAA